MVVCVALEPGDGPAQGGQIDETSGVRCAVHAQRLALAVGDRGGVRERRASCECGDDLLALAAHDDVAPELLQRRLRGDRRMGPDGDRHSPSSTQARDDLARDTEFRLGAAPEQIGRRRGHDGHSGREPRHLFDQRRVVQSHQGAVDEEALMPLRLEQAAAIAELERQVRLAATEVDAVIERPRGIEKRDLHTASRTAVATTRSPASQSASRATPSRQPIGSGSESVRRRARASATK